MPKMKFLLPIISAIAGLVLVSVSARAVSYTHLTLPTT